jgi:hypothetical protein
MKDVIQCDVFEFNETRRRQIGHVPIYALLDSGSTHSFVNPEVIEEPQILVIKTNSMVVMAQTRQFNWYVF